MEHGPFIDDLPIKNGDFQRSVQFSRGYGRVLILFGRALELFDKSKHHKYTQNMNWALPQTFPSHQVPRGRFGSRFSVRRLPTTNSKLSRRVAPYCPTALREFRLQPVGWVGRRLGSQGCWRRSTRSKNLPYFIQKPSKPQ